MRCPSCEKFVSYDTECEPEEQGEPEITDDQFAVDVRRILTCAECSEELKDATLTLEQSGIEWRNPFFVAEKDVQSPEYEACEQAMATCPHEEIEYDLTYSNTERVETKDRHGKPIKSARYMTTYYGVEVSGTATCERCKAVVDINASDESAASNMDELV